LSTTPLKGVKSEKEIFKRHEAAWSGQMQQLDPANSPYGGVKVTKGYFGGGSATKY